MRVTRVVVGHDCGLIINPDGLTNQIEGNVIQGISRALKEEVTWDEHLVTSLDWSGYRILTFPEVPTIEVALIDRPEEDALGAGEPAICPVPAAIGNAIFDATGVRMRDDALHARASPGSAGKCRKLKATGSFFRNGSTPSSAGECFLARKLSNPEPNPTNELIAHAAYLEQFVLTYGISVA